jgi:hypothetical protein
VAPGLTRVKLANKTRQTGVLAATLLLVAFAARQSNGVRDLVIGVDGCVAVDESAAIGDGTELVILAPDREPTRIVWRTAKEPTAEPPCFADLVREPQERSRVARIEIPEGLEHEVLFANPPRVFFAIPPRAELRILAGRPTRLSAQETERWFRRAKESAPALRLADDLLRHAYRYGPRDASGAVELYVGRAVLNPRGVSPAINSISIRRFFLVGGAVLASDAYERASGKEERVDTEPPQLTLDNWSRSDTERTVAFISTDDARSWWRLSTNIGFEGINWVAQELRDGLPKKSWYLYTLH